MRTRDAIVSWLKENGQAVGEAAVKGSKPAREIIRKYQMWHACPGDNGAQMLVDKAIDAYLEGSSSDT